MPKKAAVEKKEPKTGRKTELEKLAISKRVEPASEKRNHRTPDYFAPPPVALSSTPQYEIRKGKGTKLVDCPNGNNTYSYYLSKKNLN